MHTLGGGEERDQLERESEVRHRLREVLRQHCRDELAQLVPAEVKRDGQQSARRMQLWVRTPCLEEGRRATGRPGEPGPERRLIAA
eukprot:scaffold89534_cov27-Tisochrysis_lutea.AAC.2